MQRIEGKTRSNQLLLTTPIPWDPLSSLWNGSLRSVSLRGSGDWGTGLCSRSPLQGARSTKTREHPREQTLKGMQLEVAVPLGPNSSPSSSSSPSLPSLKHTFGPRSDTGKASATLRAGIRKARTAGPRPPGLRRRHCWRSAPQSLRRGDTYGVRTRPISLLKITLLRFVDSRFPGNPLWA